MISWALSYGHHRLKRQEKQYANGEITLADLRKIEDAAISELVAKRSISWTEVCDRRRIPAQMVAFGLA